MMLPIQSICATAIAHRKKYAVITESRKFTYSELVNNIHQATLELKKLGLCKNSRLVVISSNSIEFIVLFYACMLTGVIFVPISRDLGGEKLTYILSDIKPQLILVEKNDNKISEITGNSAYATMLISDLQYHDEARNLIDNAIIFRDIDLILGSNNIIDEDLVMVIYTSGSTGVPKGIMLTHKNIFTASDSILQYLKLIEEDVIACCLPLTFDYGLYQSIFAHTTGATLFMGSLLFPKEFLECVIENKCTVFPIVPSMIAILKKYLTTSVINRLDIRIITNTAAALHYHQIEFLEKTFPRAKIYSMYGMTECKRISYLEPRKIHEKKGSVGTGMPNQEIFLIDNDDKKIIGPGEGQLVVRGSHIMRGYWNNSKASSRVLKYRNDVEGRCLYTGDYFRRDDEGYLYFIGREDDIIKCHGQKVSLLEYEKKITLQPGISEVAAISIEDELAGQAVILFICCNDQNISESDVMKYCKDNLDKFMMPKQVIKIDKIIKNNNGKYDKLALRKLYEAGIN